MLMPSAQRWADDRCCGGAHLINSFPDQLKAAAIDGYLWGYFDHAVWDGQFLWFMMLYDVKKLVYMTIYVLEIELVSFFSLL